MYDIRYMDPCMHTTGASPFLLEASRPPTHQCVYVYLETLRYVYFIHGYILVRVTNKRVLLPPALDTLIMMTSLLQPQPQSICCTFYYRIGNNSNSHKLSAAASAIVTDTLHIHSKQEKRSTILYLIISLQDAMASLELLLIARSFQANRTGMAKARLVERHELASGHLRAGNLQ